MDNNKSFDNPKDPEIVKYFNFPVRITIVRYNASYYETDGIVSIHEGILARRTLTNYSGSETMEDSKNYLSEFYLANVMEQIPYGYEGAQDTFLLEIL